MVLRITSLMAVVLLVFGCSAFDRGRAEGLQLCRELQAATTALKPWIDVEAKTLTTIGKWSGMISFGGVGGFMSSSPTEQGQEAGAYLANVSAGRQLVNNVRTKIEALQLTDAFAQLQRQPVAEALKRKEEYLTAVAGLLERAQRAIPSTPVSRVPNSISELNLLLQTYDAGTDSISTATKELRVRYNITDAELTTK
jgi:hypothetical protein